LKPSASAERSEKQDACAGRRGDHHHEAAGQPAEQKAAEDGQDGCRRQRKGHGGNVKRHEHGGGQKKVRRDIGFQRSPAFAEIGQRQIILQAKGVAQRKADQYDSERQEPVHAAFALR
jgi:hypothetical protein